MNNLTVETVRKFVTCVEYIEAEHIYDELIKAGNDVRFIIGTLYKAGIIEGKRQDRARRKGGVCE